MLLNSKQIKDYALNLGVDLIGIAPASFDKEGQKKLETYIKEGRQGEMSYLEDYKKRVDPATLLKSAASVIVIGINYYREVERIPRGHGKIARYAYGRDYHKVIKKVLKRIVQFLEEHEPKSENKICVDSSPILEKSYAVQAGLGFIGKNTTLITPEFGSFVLLGEILTSLKLKCDKPSKGTCGTCTRCLDACPTKALIAPHQMDANRCISYLTIEKKGRIPKQFHKKMGNKIFGCDACQEICPYNMAHAKELTFEDLKHTQIAGHSLKIDEVSNIKTDKQFTERFAGSPLMRAKRKGLQRNAKIVQENI
ncbi:tRNA epoxyqueuosine(34) reductase QueG [Pseudomonadota bacterium]